MLDTGDAMQIPKKSPSTNKSIPKDYEDSQGSKQVTDIHKIKIGTTSILAAIAAEQFHSLSDGVAECCKRRKCEHYGHNLK